VFFFKLFKNKLVLMKFFANYLSQLHSLDGLTPSDIKTSISNATSPKAALFVPESAFELLVRRQIARMKEPSLQCVDLVFDELERIVRSIETNV
jgi:replication fork clamp-binding protein CrfC